MLQYSTEPREIARIVRPSPLTEKAQPLRLGFFCFHTRQIQCTQFIYVAHSFMILLHALSNLLGFRDASFEFGYALGVAWVGTEEVAAA